MFNVIWRELITRWAATQGHGATGRRDDHTAKVRLRLSQQHVQYGCGKITSTLPIARNRPPASVL